MYFDYENYYDTIHEDVIICTRLTSTTVSISIKNKALHPKNSTMQHIFTILTKSALMLDSHVETNVDSLQMQFSDAKSAFLFVIANTHSRVCDVI